MECMSFLSKVCYVGMKYHGWKMTTADEPPRIQFYAMEELGTDALGSVRQTHKRKTGVAALVCLYIGQVSWFQTACTR